MSRQIRLFLIAPKSQAEEIYARLEAAFEEEAWPLACTDDDDDGIFEVSLYVNEAEEAEAAARFAEIADAQPISAARLGAEIKPMSEGLVPSDTRRKQNNPMSKQSKARPGTEIKREILPQIDWVKHSLAGLKPVRAGRFFVYGAHDRDKIRQGEIPIEIEANCAFGTGHHGTTAGCLEMLEKIIAPQPMSAARQGANIEPLSEARLGAGENPPMRREPRLGGIMKPPRNILDIGTGSGILAIAAAKLRKQQGEAELPILATDNDPTAVKIAAENAALNGVAQEIEFICADGFDNAEIAARAPFDLIIANILAEPLKHMAGNISEALSGGGLIILSGILAGQRQAVLDAYAARGLRHIETLPKGDWVTLRLSR